MFGRRLDEKRRVRGRMKGGKEEREWSRGESMKSILHGPLGWRVLNVRELQALRPTCK